MTRSDQSLTELGRYTVTEGERVIYRAWIGAGIRVTETPANGRGRTFVVEEIGDEGFDALRALVADYLDQAAAHNQIPAAPPIIDPT